MPRQVEFHLKIRDIDGPQKASDKLLPMGDITIGRHSGNDIVLDRTGVSKRHAVIHCTQDGCELADLGSTNGTRLNEEKIRPMQPVTLKHGDRIRISGFELLFEVYAMQPSDTVPESQSSLPLHPAPSVDTPEPGDEPPINLPPSLPPSPPASPPPMPFHFDPATPPPGLSFESERLLRYLPDIYQSKDNEFISRFLAIFESILFPIEWQIDNFDLFLEPNTAPADFLPWLARWFNLVFDPSWSEEQRRLFLKDAHQIYARCGTAWALHRLLEIYTGETPEIIDSGEDQKPFTFTVQLPFEAGKYPRAILEQIIDSNKPGHTSYSLVFRK